MRKIGLSPIYQALKTSVPHPQNRIYPLASNVAAPVIGAGDFLVGGGPNNLTSILPTVTTFLAVAPNVTTSPVAGGSPAQPVFANDNQSQFQGASVDGIQLAQATFGHGSDFGDGVDGAPSEGCSTTTILAQLSSEPDAATGAVHTITEIGDCLRCGHPLCELR